MNKAALVQKIIAQLAAELEGYARSARAAHAEATDEQSKAENKYDTRGLEASYLARGQSKQAAETADALDRFTGLELREFGPDDPIDYGALVQLRTGSASACYFVGPSAGGTEIRQDDVEVLVVTPHSPLGQQLIGKKRGDRWETQNPTMRETFHVVSVS